MPEAVKVEREGDALDPCDNDGEGDGKECDLDGGSHGNTQSQVLNIGKGDGLQMMIKVLGESIPYPSRSHTAHLYPAILTILFFMETWRGGGDAIRLESGPATINAHPAAIQTPPLLGLYLTTTAVMCSQALPAIGRTIMPRKA